MIGEGADVVGGARDAGGSGDASEAEDGRALDIDGKGKPVDQAGINGWAGDAGYRGEEDRGDLLGADACMVECPTDGLLSEIDGGLDPGVVGLAEGIERRILLKREYDVAEFDATVCKESGKQAGLLHLVFPATAKGFGDNALLITMRRIRRADRGDAHALERPLLS